MKFSVALIIAFAFTVSSVSAQNDGNNTDGAICTTCLQDSLRALPLCKDLNITMGSFNPGESVAYAACMCSSLDGAWVDLCKDPSKCGPDVESFKGTYAATMEQAGLRCNGTTPTFIPQPTDPVEPSSALPTASGSGPSMASPSDKPSSSIVGAMPSTFFMQLMGAVSVAVAIGASFI
ncbi:hypothetical protein BX616_010574 [Lobosporangium transversale]|uniref:Extracellular membrane protein CFEM domain-containing protein n=1 Tax=Lobosporangium transversale TaxID=64571 RepID=A0A1Y2GT71_9FUNG|nr:hypothetical protein BCR41DRAFT_349484 [Lobosporangium transversale]KAF9911473.1 hypothetical protein BX616_010574 [Lobosporangium transversale]ORZ22691.1 hypothetical protein BCR41DRAFT_349484 [Lobosporangium transversale]|eukprot:XP_021883245.1 hypothetical protein BCR41DRAFT_349484 [Lobosporangium transversale]